MMATTDTAADAADTAAEAADTAADAAGLSDEDRSKDAFFVELAELAEAMMARHGKEFAMGTLVLAARFIAEGRPLIKRMGSAAG